MSSDADVKYSYAHFGVTPIVNCVGYATRVSGSCPHPDVIAAMSAASAEYIEIDDLLDAASRLIARCTAAEAGIVTSGAGAALSIGAAAILAGNDPDIMDRLPDVSTCKRTEIIYPIPGPFDYDHAVRLSGARLITIDYAASDAIERIERAINSKTAAIGFVWNGIQEKPSLDAIIEVAHRHHLPVLVDGAYSMPPVENLSEFCRRGVDLVAYSGGKHLGGPQASGILCGRADLIRSAWVQMVDMDVRSGTWSLDHWVKSGWIARSPRHGIGRSMKVSKESMMGLMAALDRYAKRDHAEELRSWNRSIDLIYDGLKSLPGLQFTRLDRAYSGQPYPVVQIESGSGPNALTVPNLHQFLRKLPRKIILSEDEQNPDRAFIYAQCLKPGEPEYIVEAIRGEREVLSNEC